MLKTRPPKGDRQENGRWNGWTAGLLGCKAAALAHRLIHHPPFDEMRSTCCCMGRIRADAVRVLRRQETRVSHMRIPLRADCHGTLSQSSLAKPGVAYFILFCFGEEAKCTFRSSNSLSEGPSPWLRCERQAKDRGPWLLWLVALDTAFLFTGLLFAAISWLASALDLLLLLPCNNFHVNAKMPSRAKAHAHMRGHRCHALEAETFAA